MMREINKSEIPDWQYGNVMLKTYSYGNTVTLADMMELRTKIVDGKEINDFVVKQQYKDSDVNIFMLAAGIHFIKMSDNNSFALAPEVNIEIKKKFVFDIDRESAMYLLGQIKELNEGLSADLKKK